VFADLDETIRQLLVRDVPLDLTAVDVSFEAPDREWSGRLTRPTVNVFLYDVRENKELRDSMWEMSRDPSNGTASRKKVPLRINATYNITVWARAPEDEHRLLWRVLVALSRHAVLPPELAHGGIKDQAFAVVTRIGQPEQVRTNPADLWQAVDNRIRPSLTYVATLTLDTNIRFTSPMVFKAVTRVWPSLSGEGEAEEVVVQAPGHKEGSNSTDVPSPN
jgi:Pvc16 N-terminal domain